MKIKLEGTEFQKKVWRAVQKIPCGQTRSYQDIAIQIGSKKASRAVARALASNPYPIVVPCHRVIGSDGRLRGYAYGGIQRKKQLLLRESRREKRN